MQGRSKRIDMGSGNDAQPSAQMGFEVNCRAGTERRCKDLTDEYSVPGRWCEFAGGHMTNDLHNLLARAAEHAADYRASVTANSGRPPLTYRAMRDRLMGPLPETGSASQTSWTSWWRPPQAGLCR